jgi:hypothetical protein
MAKGRVPWHHELLPLPSCLPAWFVSWLEISELFSTDASDNFASVNNSLIESFSRFFARISDGKWMERGVGPIPSTSAALQITIKGTKISYIQHPRYNLNLKI